jgi:hypothetical protein
MIATSTCAVTGRLQSALLKARPRGAAANSRTKIATSMRGDGTFAIGIAQGAPTWGSCKLADEDRDVDVRGDAAFPIGIAQGAPTWGSFATAANDRDVDAR